MMSKRFRITINLVCIIALFTIFFVPLGEVNAAKKTLGDYKKEVEALKTKRSENNRLTSSASASIDSKRNAIIKANNTIEENENKVEDAKVKVAESEEQIKLKTEELKKVISVLQYTNINSSEEYVSYIFEANSVSDMLERQDILNQVIGYLHKQLDSLGVLIDENTKLQTKLANDNIALNNSITEYEKQMEELEAYIEKLATIGLDYDEQIKALNNQIKNFEKAGCKDNDDLDVCYYNKSTSSGSFARPTVHGRITQAWGHNGHKGIDIGGNAKGTPVYAPANGTVAHVAYKQRCGGNEVYIHSKVNGKGYTIEMAHLTSILVKEGQNVSKGQKVATVGGDKSTFYYDKCTTGTHLHYAIAYGYWLGSGQYGYTSWSTFRSNTRATNVKSITSIKNQKGWTWNSR
jgi:murein DD-endopeptidase MepM/ murein hydrolase activator NlpD